MERVRRVLVEETMVGDRPGPAFDEETAEDSRKNVRRGGERR